MDVSYLRLLNIGRYNMRKAVYPGSFDPITFGHLDIIKRAIDLFDEVHIVILNNRSKQYMFSQEDRKHLIEQSLIEQGFDMRRIQVEVHDGLLVEYAKQHHTRHIVRGLRMVTDFEYEFQMNAINKKLMPEFETIFLMTSNTYGYLSSSTVRELASFEADISLFVSPCVVQAINVRKQGEQLDQ